MISSQSFTASFLTDNDDDSIMEDCTVPDERDWKRDVEMLMNRVGDFNIGNFVKKVLSEDEQALYWKIMKKIPVANQVYI